MCKYKKFEKVIIARFFAEGNNGGDFIELVKQDDGLLHLRMGHCCTIVADAIIPVEFLTSLVSELNGEFRSKMREMWPTEYGKQLTEKIEYR